MANNRSKKKNFISKNPAGWGRRISYSMPRAQYESITKNTKGNKIQDAIDYINESYGLLGVVTELIIEG